MELALQLGEFEVYEDPEVCRGTLLRLERHIDALSELFGLEPPRARVFVHSEVEAATSACEWDRPGCAAGWGAHATPDTIRHEVVHIFLFAAEDSPTWTRALVEEGLAQRFSGEAIAGADIGVEELERLIDPTSSSDFSRPDYLASAGILAWLVDEFGLEMVLDVRAELPREATGGEFGLALAERFGFASLADLYSEYAETRAHFYAPVPDTVTSYTSAELASGIAFDSSCDGPHAEGPTVWSGAAPDEEVVTVTRFAVPVAGEYVLTPSQLHLLGDQRPLLTPTETTYDPIPPPEHRRPRDCNADEPSRFWFEVPGQYEFSVHHGRDEAVVTTLQLEHVEQEECL